MTGLKVLSSSSSEALRKEIEALSSDCELVSVYGLNGRHVAWVKCSSKENSQQTKSFKKGK